MTTRRIRRTRPVRSTHRPVRRTIARRAATSWPSLPDQRAVLDMMNQAQASGDDKTVQLGETLLDAMYTINNLSSQCLTDIDSVIRSYQGCIPFLQGQQGSADFDEVSRAAKIAKNGEKFYETYQRAIKLARIMGFGN